MSKRLQILLVLAASLAIACDDKPPLPSYDLSGRTMGTTFTVTIVAPPATADLALLRSRIRNKLEQIENIASTYRSHSELSRFNANPSTQWIEVTPEFCSMISAAKELSYATGGAFDITVGPLVNLWGFGPTQSSQSLPTVEEISAALNNVGYLKLETDCEHSVLRKSVSGVYVDLSAWAKGYAVDELARLLDDIPLTNYIVEIGGELRASGHNANRRRFAIAIEKPLQSGASDHTVVRLTNIAVATSGDYRNFYDYDGQRYSHAIDPRNGRPVRHDLTGVTVIGTSTAVADAMATALLVLGPQKGPALAEKLGLASYFLVRTETGIREHSTPEFDKLTGQSRN